MENYDVVIVGAGVAGISTALRLSGSGYRVCLIDKKGELGHPIRPTGGTFIEFIKKNKLQGSILNLIDGGHIRSSLGTEFSLEYKGTGCIISYPKLLRILLTRLGSNVDLKLQTFYKNLKRDGKEVKIELGGFYKDTVKSKILVDASGEHCIIGKELGIIPKKFIHTLSLDYLVSGLNIKDPNYIRLLAGYSDMSYSWIFPISSDKAFIGMGDLVIPGKPPRVKEKLKKVLKLVNYNPNKNKILELHIASMPKYQGPAKNPVADNVLLVGDAGFQGSTLLGEGVRHCFNWGQLAGETIINSLKKEDYSMRMLLGFYKQGIKKYRKFYPNPIIQKFMQTVYSTKGKIDEKTYDRVVKIAKNLIKNLEKDEIINLLLYGTLPKSLIPKLTQASIKSFLE
jgi:digeranylgeranylglycerophospholipid reductase